MNCFDVIFGQSVLKYVAAYEETDWNHLGSAADGEVAAKRQVTLNKGDSKSITFALMSYQEKKEENEEEFTSLITAGPGHRTNSRHNCPLSGQPRYFSRQT